MQIIDGQGSFEVNMSAFTISSVPANGLAPPGTWASAGEVMTKCSFNIYIYTYIYVFIQEFHLKACIDKVSNPIVVHTKKKYKSMA